MMREEHDPLQPHAHEPNPTPPSADATMYLIFPDGRQETLNVAELKKLPTTSIPDCYIVSTGHGTSGPFTFTGTTLWTCITSFFHESWQQVEVISADGFGNRIWRQELVPQKSSRPIILAYEIDGRPLTRQEGLVRLIVPSETDDALRQVKWVQELKIRQFQE